MNELKAFVDKQTWTFAKTYAQKAPHEYIVRHKHTGSDEEFMQAVAYIQENGITMYYFGHPNRYFFLEGRQYWVMRASEDDQTMVLNRCLAEDYIYSIRWKGLPEKDGH